MSDPLSIAGSVAGLISLGIQATQTLVNFYSAYKAQKADVALAIKKLGNLLGLLENMYTQLGNRQFHGADQGLLRSIEVSAQACSGCIQELQAEAEKLKGHSTDGIRANARTAAYRVAYPFRQSTLQKLSEDIDEIVSHLSLGLQLLGQNDIARVHDDIKDTKDLLDLVRAGQISLEIRKWLKAPDPTVNYNNACEKRQRDTGLWFVEGPSFSAWLTKPHSFLWLKGFAGCGKSVLCSTAIRYAYRHRRSNPRVGVAFFFFTFNDESKQDTSALLRALVLQLSSQLNDNHEHLSRLYEGHLNAMPPNQALLDCLHQLIRGFDDVYILLDALDESPRDKHRSNMLQALSDIRAWLEPGLHILVTSREEADIRDELQLSQHETVSLKNDSIDHDISAFISKHLRENRQLQKWEEHYDEIETQLTERAKGV